MKRKIAAILAMVLLMSMVLSGCTTVVIEMSPEMLEHLEDAYNMEENEEASKPEEELPKDPEQEPEQNPGEEPAQEAFSMQPITDIPIGSATYLGGESIIVVIYLDDNSDYTSPWSESDVEKANEHLDVAVDYMVEQGELYGQDVVIHYQDEALHYYADIDADIEGHDEYQTNSEVNNWMIQNIDAQAIMDEYQTNSIGYLFLVNGSGISFCYPYEEGDDDEWFREKCYVYLYDLYGEDQYENPATYAHEIMHMFGAVDLYDEFPEDGVTRDVVEYTIEEYPMEIMYTTYTEDEGYSYGSIPNYISDITAYCLGWIDHCEEVDMFPTLARENAACFEQKDMRGDGWGMRH